MPNCPSYKSKFLNTWLMLMRPSTIDLWFPSIFPIWKFDWGVWRPTKLSKYMCDHLSSKYWTRIPCFFMCISMSKWFLQESGSQLCFSMLPQLSIANFYLSSYRYGFGAYFNILPGSEWSALMLTYGFPLAIIGMALKVLYYLLIHTVHLTYYRLFRAFNPRTHIFSFLHHMLLFREEMARRP